VDGLYTSATLDENAYELIVKSINYSPNARPADIRLNGIHSSGTVRFTTLANSDLDAKTALIIQLAVAPVSSTLQVTSGFIPVQLRRGSVIVYRIPNQ
jgi:alpha-N-arabinofuranosidase